MLNQLTISALVAKFAKREASAREAMQACLDRIERSEPNLHAFLSWNAEDALAQADAADREIAGSGMQTHKPLLGVPIANSSMFKRPNTMAPAELSFSITVAS
ncbi:MAG: glutamyl-tRNA(Gln) amidotransferase, subunit [Verrucomicrobiales bacterium]|nr:glutamyl-tRNA(Gln) amidotransferase, subunit [Verrucomicrobiales bacterium]